MANLKYDISKIKASKKARAEFEKQRAEFEKMMQEQERLFEQEQQNLVSMQNEVTDEVQGKLDEINRQFAENVDFYADALKSLGLELTIQIGIDPATVLDLKKSVKFGVLRKQSQYDKKKEQKNFSVDVDSLTPTEKTKKTSPKAEQITVKPEDEDDENDFNAEFEAEIQTEETEDNNSEETVQADETAETNAEDENAESGENADTNAEEVNADETEAFDEDGTFPDENWNESVIG